MIPEIPFPLQMNESMTESSYGLKRHYRRLIRTNNMDELCLFVKFEHYYSHPYQMRMVANEFRKLRVTLLYGEFLLKCRDKCICDEKCQTLHLHDWIDLSIRKNDDLIPQWIRNNGFHLNFLDYTYGRSLIKMAIGKNYVNHLEIMLHDKKTIEIWRTYGRHSAIRSWAVCWFLLSKGITFKDHEICDMIDFAVNKQKYGFLYCMKQYGWKIRKDGEMSMSAFDKLKFFVSNDLFGLIMRYC